MMELISADPTEKSGSRWRGFVDNFDNEAGLSGWVLDVSGELDTIEIELLIDEIIFAHCESHYEREDINNLTGRKVCAGFDFPPNLFLNLLRHKRFVVEKRVAVRVSGTKYFLRVSEKWSNLASILSSFSKGYNSFRCDQIFDNLRSLASKAAAMEKTPLLAKPEQFIGYVEAISLATCNMVWLTGWIKKTSTYEYSTIIAECLSVRPEMKLSDISAL